MISNAFLLLQLEVNPSLFQATHRLWTGIIDKSIFIVKCFSREFRNLPKFVKICRPENLPSLCPSYNNSGTIVAIYLEVHPTYMSFLVTNDLFRMAQRKTYSVLCIFYVGNIFRHHLLLLHNINVKFYNHSISL